MIRFVTNLFKANASAIGIDLGSSSLRLAQLAWTSGGGIELAAAAEAPVPAELTKNPRGRLEFFAKAMPQLLARGNFRGRRVVLSLPASCMQLIRVRIPLMDEAATKQAIIFEASVELPYHSTQAMIRHLIAGEVYQDNEPRNEVIIMASRRELTERYLDAARRGGVNVVGVCAEPLAIAGSLGRAEESSDTAGGACAFIDIGSSSSRIYIARGRKIQFARIASIGGDHLDTAVASQLRIPLTDAKRLRLQLASEPTVPATPAGAASAVEEPRPNDQSVLNVTSQTGAQPSDQEETEQQKLLRAEQACEYPIKRLVDEIDLSRRYHASTFPSTPVQEIVFLGGVAAHRRLCQRIAMELNLPARIADPLQVLGQAGASNNIQLDGPRSAWVVAIGLGLGSIPLPQSVPQAA